MPSVVCCLVPRCKTLVPLLAILLAGCENLATVQQPEDAPPVQTSATLKKQKQAETQTDIVNDKTESKLTTKNQPQGQPAVTDIWQRIRNGYGLSVTLSANAQQQVDKVIASYARHPEGIFQQTQNAQLYLYHIVNELDKNSVPLELALLPFVESRFDPYAYSSGRASGLWQFIPGTGKRFKLQQNWWMDQRRDVTASTTAAIAYFDYLSKLFNGDWLLVLAAYNAGEGTVQRAIKRNRAQGKATDYWSLRLPRETKRYVPKLLAWTDIIRQPEKYQIKIAPIDNKPVFESVDIGSQIDLAKLAELGGIDIDLLYSLNPAFNRWATDPEAPHELLVPANKVETVNQALTSYPLEQRVKWQHYTVKRNDALSLIAKRFKTNVSAIKTANNLSGSRIRIGQKLLIPQASKPSEYYSGSTQQRLAQRQKKSARNRSRLQHQVKSGDSLWKIAQRYKVAINDIAYWNNMSVRDVLTIKQKLVIWIQN